MTWTTVRNPYQADTVFGEIARVAAGSSNYANVTSPSTVALLLEAKAVLTDEAELSPTLVADVLERAKMSPMHAPLLKVLAADLTSK